MYARPWFKVLDTSKTVVVVERESTATCVAMFGPRVDRTFISTYGAAKSASMRELLPAGRGLRSSTFRHSVSAFCGNGGEFGGCLGAV